MSIGIADVVQHTLFEKSMRNDKMSGDGPLEQ